MGTSKGYSMPSGGEWRPLKVSATAYVKSGQRTPQATSKLLRNYVRALGGAAALSIRGSGSGGAGEGGVGSASPAATAGQRLGNFFTGVSSAGLDRTLRSIGLEQFVGGSKSDILAALLDVVAGPASTLDEVAARDAVVALTEEMFAEAQNAEDIEAVIQEVVNAQGVSGVLQDFFAEYLYCLFLRDFYEGWQRKAGDEQASEMLGEIRDFLRQSVIREDVVADTRQVDWFGAEGERLCQGILADTAAIFEVGE